MGVGYSMKEDETEHKPPGFSFASSRRITNFKTQSATVDKNENQFTFIHTFVMMSGTKIFHFESKDIDNDVQTEENEQRGKWCES